MAYTQENQQTFQFHNRCVHDAEMLQEVNILVQSLHFKGTFVVGKH